VPEAPEDLPCDGYIAPSARRLCIYKNGTVSSKLLRSCDWTGDAQGQQQGIIELNGSQD